MKEIFTCGNIFVQSFVCAAAAWWCERRLAGSRHRGESEAAGQPASLASTGGHRAHLPRLPRPAGPVQPPQFSILEGQCQSGAGRPTATRQPGLIWPGIYMREQLTQLEARGGRKEVSFLINPYWEPHYPHCLLSGQTTHHTQSLPDKGLVGGWGSETARSGAAAEVGNTAQLLLPHHKFPQFSLTPLLSLPLTVTNVCCPTQMVWIARYPAA